MAKVMEAPAAVAGVSEDWPASFFRDADRFEIERLVAWFADDIEVRFANAAPIHGREAAHEAFAGFWSTIAGLRHTRETLVRDGDTATQQSIVTYTLHDGREVSLPVASHLRRARDGRLDRLWIYVDMAPLYAAPLYAAGHSDE